MVLYHKLCISDKNCKIQPGESQGMRSGYKNIVIGDNSALNTEKNKKIRKNYGFKTIS